MTSAGGLVAIADAGGRRPRCCSPVRPAACGPRPRSAAACGYPDAVTFDMGGTSTDVCLVRGGVPEPAAQRDVGGFPIRLPALDIHTIGAGGGSIARLDPGGALVVGPESAGVDARARGATGGAAPHRRSPTPTSCSAASTTGRRSRVWGSSTPARRGTRSSAPVSTRRASLPSSTPRWSKRCAQSRSSAASIRAGSRSSRSAAPGPLHACAIADALGMPAVIVPPRAGVGSAVGLLASPRRQEVVRSFGAQSLADARAEVAALARDRVGADAVVETAVDCRYVGQSHEITVASPDDFAGEHERRNGHARPGAPVEVVAVRARATAAAPLDVADLPAVERAVVRGPAVVAEPDCTVWIPDGWVAEPRALGAWVLTRTADRASDGAWRWTRPSCRC